LLDAVEQVLSDEGKPLHISLIAERIAKQHLWQGSGKTPEATIHAQIAVDIKSRRADSRFQRTAKSTFALRQWGFREFTRHLVPGKLIDMPLDDGVPPSLTVSFTEAAEIVLKYCAHEQPMHYAAITQEALKMGLLSTQGQTPEATMYAQILTEISRLDRRGEEPRFVKHGKGLVGLAVWLGTGLQAQIKEYNTTAAKKLHAAILELPPDKFEDQIGALLVKLGFEDVSVTARSNDGGVDVRGLLVIGDAVQIRMAVQVKRWKANVQAPTVQQLRGALGNHEHGLIITRSGFSPGAMQEARRPNAVPIGLMDGKKLVGLFMEHEIGVVRTPYSLYDLIGLS